MNYRKRIIQTLMVVVILCLPVYGCGMRTTIQVQVIDAETKQPIDNAVVLIYWLKPARFLFFIPYPGRDDVELKETVSDKGGYFKMPKYSNTSYEYYLTIYKKGHVCWNNREIFPSHEKRGDVQLKNGMAIEMERFKDGHDRVDHAGFVQSYSVFREAPGLFDRAIEEETQLRRDAKKRRQEIEEKKRGQ